MPSIWGEGDKNRPSKQLDDFLSGKVPVEKANKNILTWAEHAVHDAACDILKLETLEGRRYMLKQIPPSIRPYVEREVKKLWEKRKGK